MNYKKIALAWVLTGCFLANMSAAAAAKSWPQGGVNIITDANGKTQRVVTREARKTPADSSTAQNNTAKNSAQTSKKSAAAEQISKKNTAVKKSAVDAKKASAAKNAAVQQTSKNSKSTGKASAKKTSLLTQKDGKTYFSGTELPQDYKNISIFGEAEAAKVQAIALIKANNPKVRLACSVEELVNLYWEEAGRENIRPDIALAQSLVETGSYSYGGDVQHKQNNFCGLGTTGSGVKGATFKTPQLGVRAHVQHLLAYTQKKRPSTSIVDPRYELAHKIRLERGVVDTWYGLNGTWAMGSLYCEKIMAMYQKMLAQPLKEQQSAKDKKKSPKTSKKKKNQEEVTEKVQKPRMRERMQKLLGE